MYSLSIFRSDEPFRYYRYRSSSPAAPPVVVSCSVPCRSNPMPFASLVSQFASHPPPHRFYISSRLVRLFLRLLSSAFSPVPMPPGEDNCSRKHANRFLSLSHITNANDWTGYIDPRDSSYRILRLCVQVYTRNLEASPIVEKERFPSQMYPLVCLSSQYSIHTLQYIACA